MQFDLLTQAKSILGKDIPVYKTGPRKEKNIYLMAGTHGDEPEGIYVLEKLFQWLKTIPNTDALSLIILPILNPDGVELKTRTNANQVDLNRNYPTKDWKPTAEKERYFPGPKPASEPENQFLLELLKTYPPSFIISFHSWKPVIDYNGPAQKIALFLSQYNDYPVSDYIGYPTPGSFGTFIDETYHIPVITFECPEQSESLSIEAIWQQNEVALKKLFQDKILKDFV